MAHVAMTGANGFLGWHTRAALQEEGTSVNALQLGQQFGLDGGAQALEGAHRLIHLAGVNRAPDGEIRDGNLLFAEQIASALLQAKTPPPVVVYANSIQAGNGSEYGDSKARAGEILESVAKKVGAEFLNLALPNLFGEHGKPFYNAVTATFCHLLAIGEDPVVDTDNELTLLHAQNAADLLIGRGSASDISSLQENESVSGLLGRLKAIAETYKRGEIPDISTSFERDLFNTYRSYVIESRIPIHLTRHADQRGSFFEMLRSHGGSGQSSFSTTVPGISRGDHYHRRKVERFTVLSGHAEITLRKLCTDQVLKFEVDGNEPVAIDMPTMWAHKITNIGNENLYTSFWTNDLYTPSSPDTISEVV